MDYDQPLTLVESALFSAWLQALGDDRARARIKWRLDRLGLGLTGDVRPVGSGVSELRIHDGSGYRVYFIRKGLQVTLLVGGHKGTQVSDIATALQMVRARKE